MKVPPEITYRGVEKTPEIDALIQEQIDRLHRFCEDIISCRIAIEQPHQHHRVGSLWRVRLEVTLPHDIDLLVTKAPDGQDPHEPLPAMIRDAFKAMERQIKAAVDKRRGDVKRHE